MRRQTEVHWLGLPGMRTLPRFQGSSAGLTECRPVPRLPEVIETNRVWASYEDRALSIRVRMTVASRRIS